MVTAPGTRVVAQRARNVDLDVLRAAAVVMVVLSHLPALPDSFPSGVLYAAGWFHRYGGLGVDLFFVLSGFLVSGLLFAEHRSRGTARVGRFLIRRGFKIYPAFYVFLAVTVALRLGYGDHIGPRSVTAELLFVQNYVQGVWTHTWSLAVEEHFYLLLAVLVVVLQRYRRSDTFSQIPALFGLTAALVLILRVATLFWAPYRNETHRFPTHLEIDSLAFGVLLSYWWHLRPGFENLVTRYRHYLLPLAAIPLLSFGAFDEGMGQYVVGHVLVYGGFGLLVLRAATAPQEHRGATVRLLATIGAYSYSIYLWHTAVLVFGTIIGTRVFGPSFNAPAAAVTYVVGALVGGVVMALLVERPALMLRDRVMAGFKGQSGSGSMAGAPAGIPIGAEQSV